MTAETEIAPFVEALRNRKVPVSPAETIGYIEAVGKIYKRHGPDGAPAGTAAKTPPVKEEAVSDAVEHLDDCLKILAQAAVDIMQGIDAVIDDKAINAEQRTALMNALQACSFHDLVSQRLLIIRQNLRNGGKHEKKGLRTAINLNHRDEAGDDDHLLNGPALAGEAVDQAAIDALFD